MAKYLGVIIGSVAVLLGLKGMMCWRSDFITVLKGSLPALFMLIGAIAVMAGLSEIKDEFSSKK